MEPIGAKFEEREFNYKCDSCSEIVKVDEPGTKDKDGKYPHTCAACGFIHYLDKIYPYTEFVKFDL